MNQAIRAFLMGYSGGANTLQPSVGIIDSGECLALDRETVKAMKSYEELEKAMFDIFDNLVEHYNIPADALESEVMIYGFSTLHAHKLVQKWMKERGI